MDTVLLWLNTPVLTAFGAPTTWAEFLGFATGALCVWLVARQSIWNWPIGIANNVLWILLFVTAGLYADSALQVVYIGLALWGWWLWLHGGPARDRLPVSRTTVRQWIALAGIGIAATAMMAWVLVSLTDSTVPGWDATTTVLSLLATWGQINKKVESWLIWILADVIYIPLYVYKGLVLTAILYAGFIVLCVIGLRHWRRALLDAPSATSRGVSPATVGATGGRA